MVASIQSVSTNSCTLARQRNTSESSPFHSNFVDKLQKVSNIAKTAITQAISFGHSTVDFINTNFIKKLTHIFSQPQPRSSSPMHKSRVIMREKPVDPKAIRNSIDDLIYILGMAIQGQENGKLADIEQLSNDLKFISPEEIQKLLKTIDEVVVRGQENTVQSKEQTVQILLSAIYSEQKDAFCMKKVLNGESIPKEYLKEIGDAANESGLECLENKGILTPKAAGANPLVTAIMTPVLSKFKYQASTNEQRKILANYTKDKLYTEFGKICEELGQVTPLNFKTQLEEIAKKYDSPMPS